MRFALMIEPQQGMSYADQLAVALHAEAAGFETLFRSDHYESFPGPGDRPTTDAWAVVAGLARETTRIRLGVLVSPVTYRLPGNLAKLIGTVDEMSGGRLELGLGAGWHEEEHRRYGFPFPPIEERATMLEEQVQIVDGLLHGADGFSFSGRYYTVEDARFRPRPTRRINILIGGEGSPRSMRIAAAHAGEFNLSSASPEKALAKFLQLDETCRAAGRNPATLTRSAMVGTLIGRDDAEVQQRIEALVALLADDADEEPGAPGSAAWLAERRKRWIIGTPEQARARIRQYANAGCERLMLQDFLPWDLDMIDLMGQQLVGRV
ncbi:MAG TPA: TIGR03560 family F420-dependent LLM class oxidoreductase [Candidatus Limnocylindrales bacterium]